MIKHSKLASQVYQILKGHGTLPKLFTQDGQETVDPAEAQYMWVDQPNIMIAIDPIDGTIRFEKSEDLPLEEIDKLRKQLRRLANDNVLNFNFKVIGGEIAPKDYSAETKRKEKTMESIILEGFSKLKGSTKTSYQMLENARLVIRHRLPVNEEIKGSRSRNIQAIFIESNGERFRYPINHLPSARAALRHIVEGGRIDDSIGTFIVESTQKMIKMREFVRYAQTNKLINESTEDAIALVKESIVTIATDLKKLTGAKTYESIKTRIEESSNEVLEENDVADLVDQFTVKRFDEKFLDILPDVKHMVNEKQSFLRRIEEASEQVIQLDENKYIADTIIEHDSNASALSTRLQMVAATMMENEELANYVSGLAGKLVEGELNAFETTVLGNVLRNAKVVEGFVARDTNDADREAQAYLDRNPDLDGMKQYMPSGIYVYYDPKAGAYYNRDEDRHLSDEEIDALEKAHFEWRNSQPEFADYTSKGKNKMPEEKMFESAMSQFDPRFIFTEQTQKKRNLTEDFVNAEILHVYHNGEVTELNTADMLAMQRFSNKYNFHNDSIYDLPEVNGVVEFLAPDGNPVLVADNLQNLAAEVESRS